MAEERKVTFGLTEKAAYILLYLFSWLSALIFFVSEKEDKTIRLHALQWLIATVAYWVIWIVLSIIFGAIAFTSLGALIAWGWINTLLWIAYLVVTILAIVRACNGSILKLPVAYDIASKKV